MENEQAKRLLKTLFKTQRLAVLATQGEDGPYTSLMSFAASADLTLLTFATSRATRKYQNIARNPAVALLIDDRSPERSRTHHAVTAAGKVKETSGEEAEYLRAAFLLKHPDLRDFLNCPDCALLKCSVDEYVIVTNFQDVFVYKPA